MKKYSICVIAVLFVFTAIAPAFSDIAINAENFPDANFREYVLSEADENKDGYLSEAEIASVTIMEVFEREINDLTGIEYFSSLQELYCYTNNLKSLDVSMNKELLLLECDNNKLTRLDLKDNTKLLNLECEANNLAELDLTNNADLVYVKCYAQTLNHITVSKDENGYKIDLGDYVSHTERITDVMAFNESEDLISKISFDYASGVVTVASVPKSIRYGYNVGYVNDKTLSMDVTARVGGKFNDIHDSLSSNCGGCNSGLNIFALSIIAFVVSKKR